MVVLLLLDNGQTDIRIQWISDKITRSERQATPQNEYEIHWICQLYDRTQFQFSRELSHLVAFVFNWFQFKHSTNERNFAHNLIVLLLNFNAPRKERTGGGENKKKKIFNNRRYQRIYALSCEPVRDLWSETTSDAVNVWPCAALIYILSPC